MRDHLAVAELEEVARLIEQHKRAVIDRLAAIAAEAGIVDATALGRQLAVIYEGANALAASCNDAHGRGGARRGRHPAQVSPPKAG